MKLEFDPAEYLPLREVVFKTLRNAIIRGEMKPGERLMEEKLAKSLEVSRTPVREAIRMLELEGLVVMLPRKARRLPGSPWMICRKPLRSVWPSRTLRSVWQVSV